MQKKRMQPPSTLREAVRLVGRIGGYLGRASDTEPGNQLMWQGYAELQMLCEGFALRNFVEKDK